MAAFTPTFLLTAALFFHSCSSLATLQNSKQLIQQTCGKTTYYDACVQCLESDPRSSTSTDLNVYAKVLVELALSNATNTFSYTYQLTSNNTIGDDVLKMCLSDCLVVYDIGINKLKQSLIYLDLKEYAEVTSLLGAAEDEVKVCDGVFEKPPAPKSPSPLTHRNKVFEQLCSIAMVIVKLLG